METLNLDTLTQPPDDFLRLLFAIEKALHLFEDCRLAESQMIRDLTTALADADEDSPVPFRKLKPVDLSETLRTVFEQLHDLHAAYVVEREAAAAGRELYDREHEHARAARALLVRVVATRKGAVSTGE